MLGAIQLYSAKNHKLVSGEAERDEFTATGITVYQTSYHSLI